MLAFDLDLESCQLRWAMLSSLCVMMMLISFEGCEMLLHSYVAWCFILFEGE